MSVNVWANGPGTPGFICTDARLTDRRVTPYPWRDRAISGSDEDYGQAGWDIGVNYTGLHDLAGKLSSLARPGYVAGGGPIARGEIRRLGIHAHGNSGELLVNGTAGPKLTAASVASMHGDLHAIGLLTPDDAHSPAVILLVGCNAGMGRDGTALLLALTRVWPNRKVVAFASLGYVAGGVMSRSGAGCTEPGMRDTNTQHPGEADRAAGRMWPNRRDWPWADESSPRSKVGLNGSIVSGGQW